MAQRIKRDETKAMIVQKAPRKPLPFSLVCGGLSVFMSILSLSGTVGKTSEITDVSSVAQQPAATPEDKLAEAKRLLKEGRKFYEQKTEAALKQALEKYQQALPLFRAGGDKLEEGKALDNIGLVYSDLGDQQQALNYYNQALPLFQAINDKYLEAVTLFLMGQAYFKSGDPQQALNYYNRTLPFWRTADKKDEEAEALYSVGQAYLKLKQPDKALAAYNQVLETEQVNKNLKGQALAFTFIGETYRMLDRPEKALFAYDRASVIYDLVLENQRRAKDLPGQEKTLSLMSEVYSLMSDLCKDLKQPEKALAAYDRLLEIQRQQKDLKGQANTLGSVAYIYNYTLGQPEKALVAYNQLLAVYNQILENQRAEKDLKRQAETLDSIARIYNNYTLKQPEKALAAYNRLLEIQRQQKDLEGQANTLDSIARIYRDNLNQPKKALAAYNRLLAVYNQILENQRAQKDLKGQASTLDSIARIYNNYTLTLNQPEKALAAYNQLLEVQQTEKDLDGQARTLDSIAYIYKDNLRQPEKALAAFQKALTIQRDRKDLAGQAFTLTGIARIYEDLKQPQQESATYNQILTVYNQILEIQRSKKDLAGQADTLGKMAQIYEGEYSSLNQPEKALTVYQQTLEIQQIQKDLEGQIRTLQTIASIYQNLKLPQKELAAYNQILVVYNQILKIQQAKKDLNGQITTLREIARIYEYGFYGKNSNLVQPQKALSIYQQILEIQQAQKDLDGQALTLLNIGNIYQSKLSQPKKALATYKQALQIRQQQKDLYWQAVTLNSIGDVYDSQKEEQQARISYTRAINFYKQVLGRLETDTKNPSGSQSSYSFIDRASILGKIAETYGKLGDAANTLYYGMQSSELRLAEEKDSQARVKKLYSMSDRYTRFGKRDKALDTLNRAIKIQQQAHDIAGQAETLRQIAGIHNTSSEPQKALDLYNQVLRKQQQTGDRARQVETLTSIANVYRSLGDYTFSKDSQNRALEIAKQTGNLQQQVEILSAIGNVYRKEEQYDKALTITLQALALNRSIKDDRRHELYPGFNREVSEVGVQISLGLIYLDLQDHPKAMIAANRLIELSRSLRGWFTVSENFSAYGYIIAGRTYSKQGNYKKALEAFEKAYPILYYNQTPSTVGTVLQDIGKTYVELKQYSKAITTYQNALSQFKKYGNNGVAETKYLIAIAERKRGNFKDAQKQIEAGLDVVEDFRGKLADQQLRTSYFTSVQKYYDFYIDLLMQLHKKQPSKGFNALALQASERARARSLLDLLQESQTNIRQGVDPKLLEQEKNLLFQLDALEKRRLELYSKNPTKSQVADWKREYDAVLSQHRDLETQIRATSPRYAALTQPQPLTLTEIQHRILDDNTILLEYFLGEERSYLWVVSKSEINSYELPKNSDIASATQKFIKLVKTPKARPSEISQAGTPLSQMLLAPIAQQLGQKRLVIVSNGALQYLPFAALPTPTGSGSLLSEHEIINLPSASTLATLRQELNGRKPAPKSLAIFADPVFSATDDRVAPRKGSRPNPNSPSAQTFSLQILREASEEAGVDFDRLLGTRTEAQDIAQLLPANTRTQSLDFAANKSNVLNSDLSQYRIVHFATHGILNTTRPELSAVVLSLVDSQGRPENGFLRLNDIFNLNLPSELVVLSACETGLGQNLKGEGLVGLTRGFMYAGTPRVLASLWSVDDESTATLMTLFYKAMLEKGLPPAAALRTAQLELQKQKKWQSPYYWAAFTMQGEWK